MLATGLLLLLIGGMLAFIGGILLVTDENAPPIDRSELPPNGPCHSPWYIWYGGAEVFVIEALFMAIWAWVLAASRASKNWPKSRGPLITMCLGTLMALVGSLTILVSWSMAR